MWCLTPAHSRSFLPPTHPSSSNSLSSNLQTRSASVPACHPSLSPFPIVHSGPLGGELDLPFLLFSFSSILSAHSPVSTLLLFALLNLLICSISTIVNGRLECRTRPAFLARILAQKRKKKPRHCYPITSRHFSPPTTRHYSRRLLLFVLRPLTHAWPQPDRTVFETSQSGTCPTQNARFRRVSKQRAKSTRAFIVALKTRRRRG